MAIVPEKEPGKTNIVVLFGMDLQKQPFGETEEDRLRRHMAMSDEEKFRMFTRMLRLHQMLKNAKVTHHQPGQHGPVR